MLHLHLRPASPADADVLAATVAEGFATYRAFAPPGWRAPDRLELALGLAVRLGHPALRAWLAEVDGEPAGHVTWLPAAEARHAVDDPELAHLEQLFVRRPFWGTEVASALMARAVEQASRSGFRRMRLGTPTGQLRARRFYEREGWTASGEPWVEQPLGLELVEYFRPLPG